MTLCSHRSTCSRHCVLTEWVEGVGESLALREGRGMSPHRPHSFSPCLPQLTQVPSAPHCMHTSVSGYTSHLQVLLQALRSQVRDCLTEAGKDEAQIMNLSGAWLLERPKDFTHIVSCPSSLSFMELKPFSVTEVSTEVYVDPGS